MQAFGRLSSYISQGVYTVSAPFHPFGGAVDIIVVQQQDGSFKSSPWYVQFGKFQGVLKTQEKVVKILVNEADAGFHMYLDHKGEAFFLKEFDNGATDGPIASPLTSEDETDEGPQIRKSQMLDFESNRIEAVSKIDVENGKIVARTNSRRSRIFGFFGRRSMREERGQDKVNIQRLNSLQSAEMAADLLEMKWSTNLPTTTITGRNLPKPPSRKDDKEVTGMNIVEKGTLSSGKDPDSCSQGRNLTQSLSDKDEGKESNLNVDEKRSFSSGKDPHPCSQGNGSVSGADLADMELSGPADTGEGSQCIRPQKEEDAALPSVCPVVYISESSASGDRDEKITDMPVFVFEKSDRAVVSDSHTVETVTVESKEITSLQDTALEISDEILKGPSLSSDYVVETVMLDTETKLPEDGVLDNSNKAVEHPSVIAPVDNEVKTPAVDPVLEKFQEIEVTSPSRNYSNQTVISNSKENASDDVNVDVSGISNPNLNPKHSVQECWDTDISSCVLYETEAYETSTVMLDFVDNELQTSGATRDRNELVAVNEQESYRAAKFVTEVTLTPQPVTSASENHQICHNSPFTGNLNCCGDTTNLEQGAIENSSECDKTKSSDSESQKTEMQFPSDVDIESYESIVKILHENTVNPENRERRDDIVPDKKFENQAQVEEGMDTTTSGIIGAETFQHPNSLDLESKNTTLPSIAKTNSFGSTILEEVAIGVIDKPVEIVSVRDCGPDNCSKSDPVASGDDEMPKSSEGDLFIDRNVDKISSNEPPPQQLIAEVNIEDNLLHARMKDQNSMLTSVDDNKSFDDCYDLSKNQSSEIKSPTSPDCAESNAFVQSTLSGVSSDVSNANDLDDLYSVSCFNQLSSSEINTDENEECTSLEGSARKQVDQTSNASAAEHDVCNIAETIKGAKLAVEVSLCRHLLFEGMGEAAAAKAFDAEKLNLEKFAAAGPAIVKNSRLIVKIGCHYFPWEAAAPIILGLSSYDKDDIFEPEGAIPVEKVEKSAEQDPSKSVNPSGSWRLWPFGFTKPKEKESDDRSPDESKEIGATIGSDDVFSDIKNMPDPKDTKKIVRSRIPSSEQLASLNLKEGQNSVTFSFETAMLGRQQVDARIYLWKWNARIVISDVDGTITKSDVLGQFMPLIGKDWSQTGVAHLFSAIKENGYQFIFLSARSISQAYITRQFLFNLKQDGKALPDGPVVISPDGLFPSLYREVIRRAPHEFKISCLEDIRALFPPDCNPFYAGFGNRHTDEISYVKVGVPKGKTFTINPRGEVVINRTVDAKSYVSLHALVDAMFPPTTSSEQEEFNSWNFWKPSIPDIKI